MTTVVFTGERGHDGVTRLELAGLVFECGKPIEATAEQVAALRAHPQFQQFKFEIREAIEFTPVVEPQPAAVQAEEPMISFPKPPKARRRFQRS